MLGETSEVLPQRGEALLLRLHDSYRDLSKRIEVTDTIVVGASYTFNLLMLSVAATWNKEGWILAVFLFLVVLVNFLMVNSFRNSRSMRDKVEGRLRQMYGDLGFGSYYDDTLITNYHRRYQLWIWLDVALGGMALSVPLLGRFVYHQ
ncbi:MAG: hypothetical protein ACYCWW_02505 [Deltaproteobacteria bacterium]